MKPMDSGPNLTDQVRSRLHDAITGGELAPGSLHSVYKLAGTLGVSRTPVREAVLRLADTGMVTIERNRGVRIRGITVGDIVEVFQLRLMLEVPAVAEVARREDGDITRALRNEINRMRAAERAADLDSFHHHDRSFHEIIALHYGNGRLTDMLASLRSVTLTSGASTAYRSRNPSDITKEHLPVLKAVVESAPEAAALAMSTHLVSTAELLMKQAGEITGEAIPPRWSAGLIPC